MNWKKDISQKFVPWLSFKKSQNDTGFQLTILEWGRISIKSMEFLVPLIGGRYHIITQLAVCTTYILPIGWLYGTYHLLREPGNSYWSNGQPKKSLQLEETMFLLSPFRHLDFSVEKFLFQKFFGAPRIVPFFGTWVWDAFRQTWGFPCWGIRMKGFSNGILCWPKKLGNMSGQWQVTHPGILGNSHSKKQYICMSPQNP